MLKLEWKYRTCSEAGGSLKGSSVCLESFLETSSNCWNSVTSETSSSSKGFRQATKVQYRDRSSVKTRRTAFFSVSERCFMLLFTSLTAASTIICDLGSLFLRFFFWILSEFSVFFLISARSFLYSLAWSLSRLEVVLRHSSNLSCRGSTMHSSNALQHKTRIDS